MGGFSTKNLPLRQFCGDWADGKGTMMVISPDGSIIYLKNVNTKFNFYFFRNQTNY